MSRTARQSLGAAGERLASERLQQLGYLPIAANWRRPSGELDLVMRDGDVVVFVEVKIRRGERLGAAEEGMSPAQARRILQTAELFLSEHPELDACFWRVDLVAITLTPSGAVSRVSHFPDAVRGD